MKKKFAGRHKFVCAVDGMVYYSEDKRIRWDGAIVHKDNWEPRHPLEMTRAVKEDTSVKNPQPEIGDGSDQGEGYNLNKAYTTTPFVLVDNNYDEVLVGDGVALLITENKISIF